MPFDGLAVLSLESRRSPEMRKLIENQGGVPFVAPSMREVPIEANPAAFEFAERLFAGEFDMVILLTGVGTRYLHKVLATRYPPERFPEALRRVTVVARGPKPVAACRELNVPIALTAPEPNTWREVLEVTKNSPESRIAVQEYGKSNPDLLDGLRARGKQVTAVPVYQWDLPEDLTPLREAARRLASGDFSVALFTTSVQIDHLIRVAEEEGIVGQLRQGLDGAIIASVGPTTTESLELHGFKPDFEPSHPKMGTLVVELAQTAPHLLAEKKRMRL